MTSNPTIAIIGAGNMGACLAGGLIAKHYPAKKLIMTDLNEEKLSQLKSQLKINTTTDNQTAVKQADVVILAIKPQTIKTVVENTAAVLAQKKPLIISIAAGVRLASIQEKLNGNASLVRAMPNTPALIGCGATAVFSNEFVTAEQHSLAESILRAVSTVMWVENENLLDVVTALSGSGPAYFFLIMEALQKIAEEMGLPSETARTLTLQTAYGAARMALESGVDVAELRHRVTSPGGTTEHALHVLEKHQLHNILKEALTAAKKRSEELAEIFDNPSE